MKIKQITARKEREKNTDQERVVCEVGLKNGTTAFSVLSFTSSIISPQEMGKAVESIEHTLSSLLEGKECDVVECDSVLEEYYTTASHVPEIRSISMGVSIAIAKAQAKAEEIELFELIAEYGENETITIPYPFYQLPSTFLPDVFFPLQNIFLLPLGAQSFRHSVGIWETIGKQFDKKSLWEGSPEEVIDKVYQVLSDNNVQDVFSLGIKANATHLYDKEKGDYRWLKERKTSQELFSFYKNSIEKVGVFSIQDGFAFEDVLGAETFLEVFGDKVQLVAQQPVNPDSILAVSQLAMCSNACIIDTREYRTVSQIIGHITTIRATGINTILDTHHVSDLVFVVDCAVGTSAGQIQTHKNDTQVFERLLEIEDIMTFSLL